MTCKRYIFECNIFFFENVFFAFYCNFDFLICLPSGDRRGDRVTAFLQADDAQSAAAARGTGAAERACHGQ